MFFSVTFTVTNKRLPEAGDWSRTRVIMWGGVRECRLSRLVGHKMTSCHMCTGIVETCGPGELKSLFEPAGKGFIYFEHEYSINFTWYY